MVNASPDMLEARRRKMFVLAKELGLSDDDRIEFAKALLWRDLTSWKQLNDAQVLRILDGLEGARMVIELYRQRVWHRSTHDERG
jgi:hypothetical protein